MASEARGALRALRRRNRERLIQLLRENGPLHRAELARRAGLSRSSVTTIAAELMNDGLVVEVTSALGNAADQNGRAAGSDANGAHEPGADTGGSVIRPGPGTREHGGRRRAGRAGEMLALNAAAGVALGIDYSKGEVRAVVANLTHEVLGGTVERLSPDSEWPERLASGLVAIDRAIAQAKVARETITGAGLGIPDPIDLSTGTPGRSTAGPNWSGVRAADEFARALGIPVTLDNTAHLAGLAEVMWGSGAGARNVVYVKMSYGVGAGFLFDDRIFRGAIGAAGELGHISVDYDGPACPCGNRGCLELYVGTSAILNALRPTRGNDVTLREVIAAARCGDRSCARVISDAGQHTGRVLANICNLLNPELIIVGGELAYAGDVLLDPMRETVSRYALGLASSCVRIVPAKLGNRVGALGGVALVLREADRLGAAYQAVPPDQPPAEPQPRRSA